MSNKYVKDEWGKRGTYSSGKKEERKTKPIYAPGGYYDDVRHSAYQQPNPRYVKVKKKSFAKRLLWGIIIIVLIIYINGVMSDKGTLKNNNIEYDDNGIGINFNYHLTRMIFSSEESPETEVAIRDFLNIYQIEYSNLYYDVENKGYVVELDQNTVFLSEEDVKAKAQEIQGNVTTYCYGKGSNFGINSAMVEYGYNRLK